MVAKVMALFGRRPGRSTAAARRRSRAPEVGSLEGRTLLTGYSFDPRTGELVVEMAKLNLSGDGSRYFFMGAAAAGSPSSKGDDFVVLDDGYGARRLAVNVVTRRPMEVRVDAVRKVTIIGSEQRDRIDLSFVSEKYGYRNLVGQIDGNGGNDSVNGTEFSDTIRGGSGEDTLRGGGGRDRIEGGRDNDTLIGGRDSDVMVGDAGDDSLYFADDAPDEGDGGSGLNKAFDWRRNKHTFRNIQKFI